MKPRTHVWHCGPFAFEQHHALVMGILNVTPDSFSDGGQFSETFDALVHANDMLQQGADIIEVGGESTRPGSKEVSTEDELARVLPIVKALVRENICVAVDTRHAQVARACVEAGAAIINDITGFENPEMLAVAQESTAGCVIMHMQGSPQTMQNNPTYDDVVDDISSYLLAQAHLLTSCGIEHARICLDPGPGFGKNSEQNKKLLQHTAAFANLGEPPFILMAAWSRKRFIGELSGVETPGNRVAGSVAAALYAVQQGAGIVRVHDVAPTVEALKVWNALNE